MLRSFLTRLFLAAWILTPAILLADDKTAVKEPAEGEAPPADALATTISVFDKEAPESVEDLLAMQDRVQEIIAKVTPSTVGVQIGGAQAAASSSARTAYVLTAGHVSGEPGRKAACSSCPTASASRARRWAATSASTAA